MAKLVINAYEKKSTISKNIYGHFSEHLGRCIYNGLYVGENSEIPNENGMRSDLVQALREMKLPVLRWPGGCFADEYHWKDGIGPKEGRKKMINTHWGGVTEDNSFGTHEFMELCRQIGCEPYVNANVGSGSVQEMSEWVEYMNFDGVSPMAALREENGHKEPWKVKYIGVGNENWGCGGNMTAERYADEYRRYQTFCRNYPGAPLFKIACGPNGYDLHWTEVLMKEAGNMMDGLTLHYYTITGMDWQHKGAATGYTAEEWYRTLWSTLRMDKIISGHEKIMDRYDPQKKVALLVDEWGTWYEVEPGTNPGFLYQQNTIRDAMVAGINLNIFNKHSERVRMANIAQLVNVLQSVALTDGEKLVLTPTYYVFKMYSCHQEATLVGSFVETTPISLADDDWVIRNAENDADGTAMAVPDLHESASIDKEGNLNITICNLSCTEKADVDAILVGYKASSVSAEILTGEFGAYNDFDHPDTVKISAYDDVKITDDGVAFTVPPCSVMRITAKK